MADPKTQIVITAKDDTAAGLSSVAASVGRLGGQFSGLANPIALVGTAAAAAATGMVASITSAINTGDQLNKLSQKTGIAVESLSALAYAGELADVPIEALATGIKKLSVNMSEAAGNTKSKAAEAFKALGVSATDASGALRGSDLVLGDIADRFATMKDGAGKTALAVALFGKAGSDLIPLLNQGSKGIADMTEEAKKLGLVMTGKTAKDAEEFNDNVKKLALSTSALGRAIAADLLGPLAEYTRLVVEAKKQGAGLFSSLAIGAGTRGADQKSLDELRQRAGSLQGTISFLTQGGQEPNDFVFGTKLKNSRAELAILQKQIREQMAQANEVIPPYAPGGRLDAPVVTDPDAKKPKKKTDLDRMIELGQRNLAESRRQEFGAADDDEEARLATSKAAMRSLDVEKKQADALEKQRQQYISLADPLQKYRVQLDEINLLRERGALTADQAIEAEWRVGEAMDEAAEKMMGVKEVGTDAFADLTAAVKGWGNAFTDTLADMVMTGKANFADLANSIIRDLVRIQIQKSITDPIIKGGTSFLDKLFKGGGGGGGYGDTVGVAAGVPQYAQGTPWVPNDGLAYLHRGEAVIPAGMGMSGGGVTVNLIENGSKAGQVQQRQSGGQNMIDIFVAQIRSVVSGDMTSGSGPIPAAMQSTYGLNRAAGGF